MPDSGHSGWIVLFQCGLRARFAPGWGQFGLVPSIVLRLLVPEDVYCRGNEVGVRIGSVGGRLFFFRKRAPNYYSPRFVSKLLFPKNIYI